MNCWCNWTAPLDKLGSHRRQTVDAKVNVFHRLAADGYDNFATPNRPSYQVAASSMSSHRRRVRFGTKARPA